MSGCFLKHGVLLKLKLVPRLWLYEEYGIYGS